MEKRTTGNGHGNGNGNNNIQLKAILNRKIFSDHLFIDDKCMHISKPNALKVCNFLSSEQTNKPNRKSWNN